MRYKYFLLVFLINLSLLGVIEAQVAKKDVIIVDIRMKPEALVMGTEFFKSLDVNTVKGISLSNDNLIQALKGFLPTFDIKSSPETPENNRSCKTLVSDLINNNEKIQQADYLICSDVNRIELQQKKHSFNSSDSPSNAFYGQYIISLRIVNLNTKKIVYADKISQTEIECIDQENKNQVSFIQNLKENILNQLAIRISETIQPIKIVRIADGYAYLEYKEPMNLQKGMKLGVYIPTRPSIDSKTGEITGDTEHLIGELKIIDIVSKNIRAQILKYSRPLEAGMYSRIILETENVNCPAKK